MLRSEDVGVHYEAVGVIGNLVHSSQNIKRRVLEEQALQPVINLLGSSCPDSQREAALLLGQVRAAEGGAWLGRQALLLGQVERRGGAQGVVRNNCIWLVLVFLLFCAVRSSPARKCSCHRYIQAVCVFVCPMLPRSVLCTVQTHHIIYIASVPPLPSPPCFPPALQFATTDADTKAHIVQRGAVPSLITMLSHTDTSLREMAAFALGRLAQNSDNQAGVVQCGGLVPLLGLLESKHYNLQHNAAFALYGLADNEDNIADIVREGVLQRLLDCAEKLQVQASKVREMREGHGGAGWNDRG